MADDRERDPGVGLRSKGPGHTEHVALRVADCLGIAKRNSDVDTSMRRARCDRAPWRESTTLQNFSRRTVTRLLEKMTTRTGHLNPGGQKTFAASGHQELSLLAHDQRDLSFTEKKFHLFDVTFRSNPGSSPPPNHRMVQASKQSPTQVFPPQFHPCCNVKAPVLTLTGVEHIWENSWVSPSFRFMLILSRCFRGSVTGCRRLKVCVLCGRTSVCSV